MAVNLEELQTFVNNFIDLTNKGIDVNLSLNYYSGQVTVNLQTTFKKVQLPPNSSTLSESHLSTSSKPSRKRRRKRRQLARDLSVAAKNEPAENEKKQYMDSFQKTNHEPQFSSGFKSSSPGCFNTPERDKSFQLPTLHKPHVASLTPTNTLPTNTSLLPNPISRLQNLEKPSPQLGNQLDEIIKQSEENRKRWEKFNILHWEKFDASQTCHE